MYEFFSLHKMKCHIRDKNLNFLFIIYKVKSLVSNVTLYQGLRG